MSFLNELNLGKMFVGEGNCNGGAVGNIVQQMVAPALNNALQAMLTGGNVGDALFNTLGCSVKNVGNSVFLQVADTAFSGVTSAVAGKAEEVVDNIKEKRAEKKEEKENNKVYDEALKNAEDTVATIFETNGWTVKDNGIYKDAVAEYQQIIQAAQQNGTDVTTDAFKAYAQLTVENYARRVELAHQELDWGLGVNNNNYEVAGLTQADMENNNADAVKAAYENFANGEIAYYDTNNDEVITLEEYQALSGAKSAEDKALVQSNFNIIDHNNDGKIDAGESAAFNWAMSKILDKEGQVGTSNDITADETTATAEAMLIETLIKKGNKITPDELAWLESKIAKPENIDLYNRFKGLLQTGNQVF